MSEENTGFIIPGKTYDLIKAFVQLWLPAIGTLYFTLAQIWGLPGAEQVLGTIVAISTFFGVTLKISSKNYENSGAGQDGTVVVTTAADGVNDFRLILDTSPEDLASKDTLVFKKTSESVPDPDAPL